MNLRGGLAFQSVCTRALLLYFPAISKMEDYEEEGLSFFTRTPKSFLTYHSKLTCMTIRDKLALMSFSMVLHLSFFVTLAWMIVRLVPSVLKWYFTDPLRLLKVWWCCNIQWGREHCFSWTATKVFLLNLKFYQIRLEHKFRKKKNIKI